MKRIPLHTQIFAALVLAVVSALLLGGASVGPVTFVSACDFVGTLFLNALKMLIVPLVVASIVNGIAGLGSMEGFGRLGLKTVVYYVFTSLIAIIIGLSLVNLIRPGIAGDSAAIEATAGSAETQATLAKVEARSG